MSSSTISLGEVLTDSEIKQLRDIIKANRFNPHSKIMKWINDHPTMLADLYRRELIPDFFGYLVEHILTNEHHAKET